MLFGFGIRVGAPTQVLRTIGALVVGAGASPALAIMMGIVLNVIATLACGVAYATLTGESGDNRVAWAITLGAAMAAAVFVIARIFAGSIALVLTPGNLVAIGVVIAITLPIGMRFAPTRV